MHPLFEWQTFFSVEAESAAALTGLVFVAVSINLTKILASSGLPGRAIESIAQFLQVFFISAAMLIPRQTMEALAIQVIALALLSWILQIAVQVKYAKSRSGDPKYWLVSRIVTTQLGSIPLFVAAISLLRESSAALYWLVPGCFLSFSAGVLNAWILLVEINR